MKTGAVDHEWGDLIKQRLYSQFLPQLHTGRSQGHVSFLLPQNKRHLLFPLRPSSPLGPPAIHSCLLMGVIFTHHICQLQRNNGVTKNSALSFYEQIFPQIWLSCSLLLLTESFLTPFPRPQQTNSLIILSKEALCPTYYYSPEETHSLSPLPTAISRWFSSSFMEFTEVILSLLYPPQSSPPTSPYFAHLTQWLLHLKNGCSLFWSSPSPSGMPTIHADNAPCVLASHTLFLSF